MDYNILIADFAGKNRICMTDTLYQYDYGQKLQIDNIPALPQTFEAHFSNVQGGVSITVVGMDGVVDIPNTLLMTGKRIYCWIYVTEPGSGETEYQILIPVQARPMPEYYDVTDVGVFDSVVQQVGDYAATATAGATSATASAAAAATSASEAAASASAAETAKTAAETAQGKAEEAQAAAETAAQTATEKAQQTAQDAAQAASDAGRAESAAQSAKAAQTGAESAKTDAETAAQGAAASASAASASATSAGQAATSASQSATAAAGSATTASTAAQTATTKAGEASASASAAAASETAAQTAQIAAETAETNAGQSASTATAKAAEAAQSASNAADSETAAEAAATRAEQAAASLTVDDALSDTSTNPVENRVITAEVARVKNAIDALKIIDTASGAIASFSDGADMPLESLTVEMSPIQDLHGYDSPWPAGGGKNLLQTTAQSKTENGVTWTVNDDGSITASGTATGYSALYIAETPVTSSMGIVTISLYGVSVQSNIAVNRISLLDSSKETTIYTVTGGGYSESYTVDLSSYPDVAYIAVEIKRSQNNTAINGTIYPQIELGSTATAWSPYSNICPISGHESVTVWREATYDTSADPTLTIQLGQTVYGGNAEIISGQGQSTMAIVEAKNLQWVKDIVLNPDGSVFTATASVPFLGWGAGGRDEAISNILAKASAVGDQGKERVNSFWWNTARTGYRIIWGKPNGGSTLEEFMDFLAEYNVVLCGRLAEPTALTLDPVTLSTLKGDNNVWSDADSVTVDYVSDPKLYIDKKITAAVAALA